MHPCSLEIRQAKESDLATIMAVETAAFGSAEEADLVKMLLVDESAKPWVSLLASGAASAVGHILFTRARLTSNPLASVSLLAPLAVMPHAQKMGVGGQLIEQGAKLLGKREVSLIFVLGYPEYYPHHGFRPAGVLGFDAPYPIPKKNADAWMVRELRPGALDEYGGATVITADTLNKPEYWRE